MVDKADSKIGEDAPKAVSRRNFIKGVSNSSALILDFSSSVRVLLMPEQDYHIDGRVVRFPANTDKPENGLTVEYYPRVTTGGRGAQRSPTGAFIATSRAADNSAIFSFFIFAKLTPHYL